MLKKSVLIFLIATLFNIYTSYSKSIVKDTKPMLYGEICLDNLNYEFYDLVPPNFTVDNIPTTGALSTGIATNFNVSDLQNTVDPGDTNRYSIRYTATLTVDTAGTYFFFTTSDDGSKLLIDGTEVVDNDGTHSNQERSGSIFLSTGNHSFEVTFFENTGNSNLLVSYGLSATDRISIPFCSEVAIINVDTDGDTILDRFDLDDDNDGILDTDEEGCYGVLNYEFYDLRIPGGTVDNIPTTGALSTGTIGSFNPNTLQNSVDPGDTNDYGIRFTGNITIATAGEYTFFTTSDDGSKLFIDGFEVVDNDGLHSNTERSGTINLTEGLHRITVLFFERGGNSNLLVRYQSSSILKTDVPFNILSCSLDSDLDGTPNYLDTNSDNDACPDALEGAGTFSVNDLANYNTDISLGDNVDANGIPIVNGTSAQQNNTAEVVDENIATCTVDLSLTKTVNNTLPKIGDTIVFTITLTNTGSNNATNIIVRDVLPSSLAFDSTNSNIPSSTTYNNTTGIWDLSGFTLTPNNSISLQIAVTINASGVITNATEIISLDQIDIDSTPNSGN